MLPQKVPYDSSIEAEYEDGYIHSETELDDISAFGEGNVFTDILKKRLEAHHGRMVRFSVFWKNERYDVNWTELPDNARPIRFRHGYSMLNTATGEQISGFSGVDFGFQYNDSSGRNEQEIVELR